MLLSCFLSDVLILSIHRSDGSSQHTMYLLHPLRSSSYVLCICLLVTRGHVQPYWFKIHRFNCFCWNTNFKIPDGDVKLHLSKKHTRVKHFLFHLCRPWTAFSSWLTWRATSCLCLRMWPSTCITTRRSSWTPVSTACCMLEIMLSSSRTSYQSPSVSHKLIFPPNLYFALWIFLLFAALVCHTFPVFLHVASSLCFWSLPPSSL